MQEVSGGAPTMLAGAGADRERADVRRAERAAAEGRPAEEGRAGAAAPDKNSAQKGSEVAKDDVKKTKREKESDKDQRIESK